MDEKHQALIVAYLDGVEGPCPETGHAICMCKEEELAREEGRTADKDGDGFSLQISAIDGATGDVLGTVSDFGVLSRAAFGSEGVELHVAPSDANQADFLLENVTIERVDPNGNIVETTTIAAGDPIPFEVFENGGNLDQGVYRLSANATDSAGNQVAEVVNFGIVEDLAPFIDETVAVENADGRDAHAAHDGDDMALQLTEMRVAQHEDGNHGDNSAAEQATQTRMAAHSHGGDVIEDNNAFLMAMGEGSRIEIHAADASKDGWTQLDRTAEKGDNTITVENRTGWEVGDKIGIATTDFDARQTEEFTITGVSADGQTFTLDRPMEYMHYGELQNYDNGKTGADAKSWVLDERAEVALLSRNVEITGDADSIVDGFGGHTMVMHGAEMHISGAEFDMMGQAGILGRYPVHWHQLDDGSGQYIENSSIHHSYNKGITVHGTNNTHVTDNVVFEVTGHGYFLEDAVETGNVFRGNLALNANNTDTIIENLGSDKFASGFWITNPDNHLIDNHAAGSGFSNFWITGETGALGASGRSGNHDGYVPLEQALGVFEGNTSHSSYFGLRIGGTVDNATGIDTVGNPLSIRDENGNAVDILIDQFTATKHIWDGIWTRQYGGEFTDNIWGSNGRSAFIRGQQTVEDTLVLGHTDNAGNARTSLEEEVGYTLPNPWIASPSLSGISLYDEPIAIRNVHYEGFTDELNHSFLVDAPGVEKSPLIFFEGITSGDDTPYENIYRGIGDETEGNYAAKWSGFTDLDGSLTGYAQSIITPETFDPGDGWSRGASIDTFNGVANDLERAGLLADPNAFFDEELGGWVNERGNIGVFDFNGTGGGSFQNIVVERSDGKGVILGSEPGQFPANEMLMTYSHGDYDTGIEYTVDFVGDPRLLKLQVEALQENAWVYLRVPDVPANAVIQGADFVDNSTALESATGTAYLRDGGDILVKIIGTAPHILADSDNPFITARSFSDAVIVHFVPGTHQPSGDFDKAFDHWAKTDDFFTQVDAPKLEVPNHRIEGDSNTVSLNGDELNWSDAETWDGTAITKDSIVVINGGQEVILDTSVQVKGIIVNGADSALIIKDQAGTKIDLIADWILINDGALFQAGTESNPLDTDFRLELTGDDPDNDVHVTAILDGQVAGTVMVTDEKIPLTPYINGQFFDVKSGEALQWVWDESDLDLDGVNDGIDLAVYVGNYKGHVGSLVLYVDGKQAAVDNTWPFDSFGDGIELGNGVHDFVIRAYSEDNGGGTLIVEREISLEVVNSDYVPPYINGQFIDAKSGEALQWVWDKSDLDLDGAVEGIDLALHVGSYDGNVGSMVLYIDGEKVAVDSTSPFDAFGDGIELENGAHSFVIRAYTGDNGTGNLIAERKMDLTIVNADYPEVDPIIVPDDGSIHGTFGDDIVTGTDGDDVLLGHAGNDVLNGDAGDDHIDGGHGDDDSYGGDGNDWILGSWGTDSFDGGSGIDTLDFTYTSLEVTFDMNSGTITFAEGTVESFIGIENVVTGSGASNVFGDTASNEFVGGSGDDLLIGGRGRDDLYGGFGNDRLEGGYAKDQLFGEGGDDVLFGGNQHDLLSGGDGEDHLYGEHGNDVLDGGESDDVLDGGVGNDLLNGAAGNDQLSGGTGNDTFLFNSGDGYDRITDFMNGFDEIAFDSGAEQFSDLLITDTSAGARIVYDGGTVLVQNVSASVLDVGDFDFV